MENTRATLSLMSNNFYLLRDGEDFNFTIESKPNLLPHDGVFAIIATNKPNVPNLFRTLMTRSYDFDSVNETAYETVLEGYCVYNIGFTEAIILGEMVSCKSIFYRHLDKIGIYSIPSRNPLQEIIFDK